MDHAITHEDDGQRGAFFILQDGERIAEMTYVRRTASAVVIDHTLVTPALRGRNVAGSLLDAAVAWARRTGTKLSATCSYVQARFARDPGLRDVQG
jgi:predicted GNAT family acetyltransferase